MILALLLSTAPTPGASPDAQAIESSARLLLVTALLGVILVTALTLIVVLRRNRLSRARIKRERSIETPDAWAEAGRRTQTPDDEDPDDAAQNPNQNPRQDPPLG